MNKSIEDGVGARRNVSGRFANGEANPGFEPLPILIVHRRDERDRRTANERRQIGQIVKNLHRHGVENVVMP